MINTTLTNKPSRTTKKFIIKSILAILFIAIILFFYNIDFETHEMSALKFHKYFEDGNYQKAFEISKNIIAIKKIDFSKSLQDTWISFNSYKYYRLHYHALTLYSLLKYDKALALCLDLEKKFGTVIYNEPKYLDNNQIHLYEIIGRCYLINKNYKSAQKYFKEAERLKPDSLQVLLYFGTAYEHDKNHSQFNKIYNTWNR